MNLYFCTLIKKYKVIKKLLKIALGIVLVILLMLSIILLLFQYKPVQTWAAKKATAYLSDKLKTKVDIQSLYIKPFTAVVLEGFYVLDKKQDTLISTPKLTVDINGFSLFSSIRQRKIDLSLVQLDNGSVYLKKQKDSTSNLKFLTDFFSSPDTIKTKGKPWTIKFEKVAINNLHFRYKNQLVDTAMAQVNFEDIDVKHFSVVVRDMDLVNHLFKGTVSNLTLHEKSGFYLKNFSGNATVDTNQILVQNMFIQTNHSSLKNYFRMKFKSFDDFDDIEEKVYMDGEFKSSQISSHDIAYFTGGLEKVKFDLGIDGRIRGYVNNLKAKNLLVTGGQATYVKGDFNLKGLPDWDNTFLELNFEQVATNKKDLDYLVSNFTGKPTARVPDVIAKFGAINFTGRFTGLQNDFVAYGTFKTKLGRFDPDINLKINKAGVPSYSGKIATYNFDLGTLIDESDIGRTSLTANVTGSGDQVKSLTEKLDARISKISFKGYNYSNVKLNGTFIKQLANIQISIDDKNIRLDAKGSIDLNPKLPAYNFEANINDASLNTLNLLKDTIRFSTYLTTNFSGNTLNNTEGHILFSSTRVVDPRNNYVVDSVYLSANGVGENREISLKSDIADGSLKGSYDLNTLPSYFKTIVKKYIPSLKTEIVTPRPQNFAFNLKLKDLNPLLAMFVPDLKIPDQGTFIGQFNSADKTATLTGSIKTIQYGQMVFHDFILDENTTDRDLELNLSLSKINFTDSLFIKNINIANFLRKDSLNFNVKLADKDATNQLDLYGLVQFGRDTTAKLQLLPSDVILEHQYWRITDQVRIRLLDGKTKVSGFELSNGSQKVKINGFISADPADKLKVEFDKFSMVTLDQLTKSVDIKMKGMLNGALLLSGVTKSPAFDAHLDIDSFVMNKTLIGNVKIASSLDSNRSQANAKMVIMNRGLETMNIDGAYLLGKDTEDRLNFDIRMNQTEAIIFAPFVKDLVSNLKGNISSDLKLTGPPSNPQLNGDVTLINTGVTVNYLKTAYTVNNKLTVKNSVIDVDGMVLKDVHGGEGAVTGTVDLNKISNPDIQVVLTAKNLMALNTTFRDNHIYYGTAYGTGRFSFSGPTDNMKIDIKAQTEAGTIFNIPLNTSSIAEDYDFIKFVSHKDTAKKAETKARAFNGISLNFDLTVDEKTIVKITTDYGKLEGNGVAKNLNLNISSLGDFSMFGDFLISTGKFEFIAKDVISKNFQVTQGGTIRWTGNPSNAEINMKAIYEVRTDISKLYTAAGLTSPTGPTQVLVQANLLLTKSLLQPTIDFDFNFPTDPSIKDNLGTYLNDYNNRSQQALSIIVRRQFAAGSTDLTQQALGTAGEAVSEFAFNKLNTIISQSNTIKSLDLNIRSFNDASASLRLFNERFVLSGSLYSTVGTGDLFSNSNNTTLFNSNFNNLSKDFSAQYLITKNGNLTARYSYRLLNNNTLTNTLTAQYVNGLGLVYQRDFDTFGEFIKNMFGRGRNKKAPVMPIPQPATTPGTGTPSGGKNNVNEKPDDNDQ